MSKKNHYSRRRRRFAAETLEPRNLMAAKISELLIDVQFGDNDKQALVELRSEPNAEFAEGSYLALINEDDFFDAGEIHSLINLSGLTVGNNGFLTLLQADSPHRVHPDSAVVRSTSNGFRGLPNDRFTSVDTGGDLEPGIFGSTAFILLQTDSPIAVGMDVDVNNDGVLDPSSIENWEILDAISVHPFVGGSDFAYSPIVFANKNPGETNPVPRTTALVIETEGYGYVGRVGASNGSTAEDWLAGTVQLIDNAKYPGPNGRFELADNLFGPSDPYIYAGRDLDHFGDNNFIGGIQGQVLAFEDGSARTGLVVLADTNGNGIRDNLKFVVEPDLHRRAANSTSNSSLRGNPLTNAYPGVTITDYALNSFPSSTVTSEPQDSFFGLASTNNIFSGNGIDWFSDSGQLRFDFYQPVRTVSIDAIGSGSSLSLVYGRLDAYDAEGNIIESVISRPLANNSRQTISIELEDERIVRAQAYAMTDFEDNRSASPFGRFDKMQYGRRELVTTTDEEGRFEFRKLTPGNYAVNVLDGDRISKIGSGTIERYETLRFNLTTSENVPPETTNADMSVSELASPETVIGRLTATDSNEHPLRFAFTSAETYGLLVRPETGDVIVGPNSRLDFETVPSFSIEFTVTDPFGSQATGVLEIAVDDGNDAPSLELPELLILPEMTPVNTVIGNASGSDDDRDQTIRFRLIEDADGLVSINAEDGDLTLLRPLDFETNPGPFRIVVEATDDALVPLSRRKAVRIEVGDANDFPTIISDLNITVSDTAKPGDNVHLILASDPDEDSFRFRYEADGGSGAEYFNVARNTGHITVAEDVDLSTLGGQTLELNVIVSDFGTPVQSSRATLAISITDNNRAPVFGNIERLTIAENSPAGTILGKVLATDPDEDSIRYEVTSGTGRQLFRVNPENGDVSVAPGAVLNFESRSEYSLTITAVDDGEPSLKSTRSIQIRVTDVAESIEIDEEKINPPAAVVGRRFEYQMPSDLAGASGETSLRLIGDASPKWLKYESAQRRLVGIPTSIAIGTANVTFEISGPGFEPVRFTFPINVTESGNILVNEVTAGDVNNDGEQSALDALAVINFLRRSGSDVPVTNDLRFDGFFDVSGDRRISPLDALEVINRVRRFSSSASGESVKLDALEDAKVKRRDVAITELYGTESRLF